MDESVFKSSASLTAGFNDTAASDELLLNFTMFTRCSLRLFDDELASIFVADVKAVNENITIEMGNLTE